MTDTPGDPLSSPPQKPRDTLTIQRPPPSPRMSANRSSSLAETFRSAPLSPRSHRTSSVSGQAIQELLNNPPSAEEADPRFEGRDWRSVSVGEVIEREKVRFVELGESVERATEVLVSSGSPNVVLLKETADAKAPVGTFDYSDLNAYLLLVVGLARPDESQVPRFKELAAKGREGKPIPMRDVIDLGPKEPMVPLIDAAPLTRAVEIFGSGIHRILITEEDSSTIIGVLTQLQLVRFFWQNRGHFGVIEPLFHKSLKELELGSVSVIAINGDRPLTEALEILHHEGITSLPVLDNHQNVVGNISHVDVRLLTKSSATTLLHGTCLHFISVILSERGVEDGKDAYPVFYVNPTSTLAHTVAKLVATRSHRMWIVESSSPASSGPPTPAITPATPATQPAALSYITASASTPITATPSTPGSSIHSSAPQSATFPHATPYTPSAPPSASTGATAASIPGGSLSGHLTGVVSLTDILNLFAKASGLNPIDPAQIRRARRRSSSASVTRRSVESSRSESVGASSVDNLSRSGSISGRAGR